MCIVFSATMSATTFTYDRANTTNTILDITHFNELSIAKGLWSYMSMVYLVVGTIGNGLSFVLMSKTILNKSVTSFYLRALAVADTLVLYVGLLRQWIRVYYGVDVRGLSNWGCKLHIFMVYWSTDFAAYVVAAVSMERLISVIFPHQAKKICTKKAAGLSLLFIGIFLFVLNVHFFWTFALSPSTGTNTRVKRCFVSDPKYDYFNYIILPWLDFTFFSAVPFLIILCSNLTIIFKVACNKLSKSRSSSSATKLNSLTVTLMLVSLMFLLGTTPITLYLLLEYTWVQNPDPHVKAMVTMWWAIVNMCLYSNNSVNFFLYIVSGPSFRRALISMICKNKVHPIQTGTMRNTSSIVAPVRSVGMTQVDH